MHNSDVWMCGRIRANISGHGSLQNVLRPKIGDLVFPCESLDIIDEIRCASDNR